MAKTLMYVPGSPTSVKLGDTDTDLYLQVAKDNVAVDLTTVKSITVKIADANKNYLKDISIAPASLTSGNNGILTVPLNSDNIGGLNSGDYYFEVWIVTADSETEIYPDMNVTKFHVFNNLVGGTTILTTLTMQAFLDRITSTQTASETSLSNSKTALANANTALTKANTANTNAAKTLSDLNAGNYLTKDTLSNAPSFDDLQNTVASIQQNINPTNKLTVQDMNFWTKSSAAQSAATIAYSTGVNIFSYKGVSGFETFELSISGLTENQDYTFSFSWKNDQTMNPLTSTPYIPVLVTNYDIGSGHPTTGNLATLELSMAETDWENQQITFNTGSDTTVYISFDFGYVQDSIQYTFYIGNLALNEVYASSSEVLTQSDYAKIKAAIVALGGSLS